MGVSQEKKPSMDRVRSVLIIKPSSLGDVVHTLPAVRFLKRAWPDLAIDWLVNTEWMPLLEGNPDLRNVLEFPRKRFRGVSGPLAFLRWSKGLCQLRPGLVLDFQGLTRSYLCARASKAERIYCLGNAEFFVRTGADRVVPVEPGEHAVERYLRLVTDLGVAVRPPLEFPLPEGNVPAGFDLKEPFLLLHPFSRGTGKSMPEQCVERICEAVSPVPVVVAGRAEASLSLPANAHNFLNRTTLPELVWLIRHAAFTVSVDSGPMHIASALTARLLAVHTWSDPRKVGPYNKEAWLWKGGRLIRASDLSSELAVQNTAFTETDLPPVIRFLREQVGFPG